MSRQYRINYSTRYQAKCSKRAWKEDPPGLVYARLGHIKTERDKKRTVVGLIAICNLDGQTTRTTRNVYIYSKDVRNVRLKLVDMPD